MKKTVISHFFNEEHLLPWWTNHHKQLFDHGIMIDYHSTDRSREIINEICPTWEIRYTRNQYFDSTPIDQEVMDIERELNGWRVCLNTTEFLYGNIDRLGNTTEPTQYFVGNYVFVDMEDKTKGPITLDHTIPLHEQRYWGYDDFVNNGKNRGGSMGRMSRSIHNYPVTYTGGRHWPGHKQSFDDLVIFYYGWADSSDKGLKRKTQIVSKIKENGTVHHKNELAFVSTYKHLRGISNDLSSTVQHIYSVQQQTLTSSLVKPLAQKPKLIQAPPRVVE